MNTEVSRPDRFTPRWPVPWPDTFREPQFCQQVGAYDVYLMPHEVWMVSAPAKNGTPTPHTEYMYDHAAMRFPAIEHKIIAMRAMLFSNR